VDKRPLYRDKNLQIIFGVTLMAVMAVSSVTPAFPKVIRALDISGTQVGLLITFFTLPGVIMAPFLGVLADRWGRKKILVPSLLLFAVAGTACAFVTHFPILLGLRTLQGVGGASLGTLAPTLIGDIYSGQERAAAMGLNASVLSIGTASYPAIGGVLATLGWNYPFALPILAVPIGLLVIFSLDNPEPENSQGVRDYLAGAVGNLWNLKLIGLFAAGIALFIILYGTYLTYFTLLLDQRFHAPAYLIGIMLSVMSVSTALVSSQLGRISAYVSLDNAMKLGFLAYALSLLLIPQMTNLWLLLIPLVLFGAGHGANVPSLQTSVAAMAPLEYRAAFMSIMSMVIRIGQTLGPPVMGVAYAFGGLDLTFYVAAVLAGAVSLVGVISGIVRR